MKNTYAGRSIFDYSDEVINLDIPGSDKLWSDKQVSKCEEFEASNNSRGGLSRHTSSKHGGVCFPCKYCRYKAT